MNDLGLSAYHLATSKTKIGYSFHRICKQKDCNAFVCLKLKVTNGMGTICFKEKLQTASLTSKNTEYKNTILN